MSDAAASARNQLFEIFPPFKREWESVDNLFVEEDGTFTTCGVFCQFTNFFRESFHSLTADDLDAFGLLIEEYMSDSQSELDTAVTTCFLENIAGDYTSREYFSFLGPVALRFMHLPSGAA